MSITRRRFLSTSALAAAGGLAATRGLRAAPRAAAQSGTLTVWGWDGTYEGIQSQIGAFNQKYPDVMVNVQTFDYDTVHKAACRISDATLKPTFGCCGPSKQAAKAPSRWPRRPGMKAWRPFPIMGRTRSTLEHPASRS